MGSREFQRLPELAADPGEVQAFSLRRRQGKCDHRLAKIRL